MDKRYETCMFDGKFQIWDKMTDTYERISDDLLTDRGHPLIRYLDELNENEAIYYREILLFAYDLKEKTVTRKIRHGRL